MSSPDIEKLISIIEKFPGMGRRSASRTVVHLLKYKHSIMETFINVLKDVYSKSVKCEICNNIDTSQPCRICLDTKRDKSSLCVVATLSDLWSIERTGFYKGLYYVTGGKLSAIDGITPQNLNTDNLKKRIIEEDIKEVIIAMSADIDGQTTMFFIKDSIKDTGVKITTLSHGMPIGGDFDYLDEGTIVAAFTERKAI